MSTRTAKKTDESHEVYLCTLVYTQICAWMKPNHPEHSSKLPTEGLQKKRIVLAPAQSKSRPQPDWSALGVQRTMHKRVLQTSINWRHTIKKSGPRILHNYVKDWWRCTENHYFKLCLLQIVLEVKSKLAKQLYTPARMCIYLLVDY